MAGESAHYYATSVPAWHVLQARGTPSPTFEGSGPALDLIDSCDQLVCQRWDAAPGNATLARLYNLSDAARDVIIAVSNAELDWQVDLALSHAPLAYHTSLVDTSCDDLSAATVLQSPEDTVDEVSTTPLPFTFSFFGRDVAHFEVWRTGALRLRTEAGKVEEISPHWPDALPVPDDRRSLVAPFWGHRMHASSEAPESDMRWQVFGAAGTRRVIVQWTNWGIAGASDFDSDGTITMQAKLFEGTGVVELHYCAIETDSPLRSNGEHQDVGLQAGDGATGVRWSHQRVGAVSTEHAIRFTPVP